MGSTKTVRAWVVLLAMLLVATGVQAGTRVETTTKRLDRPDRKPEDSTLRIQGRRMRVDARGDRSTLLFDAGEETAWLLDHRKKTVFKVDAGTTRAVASKIDETRDLMRERLKNLPPEQRAQMERLLAGATPQQTPAVEAPPPPQIVLRATGARDAISGVACDEVEVLRDGRRVAEVCRATFEDAGVPEKDFAIMRDLGGFLRDTVSQMVPGNLQQAQQDGFAALESMEGLDGIPMRVRAYDKDRAVSETLITSIAAERVEAAAFKVPDGYQGGFSLDALRDQR